MADTGYDTGIYMRQGGDVMVLTTSGTIEVGDGTVTLTTDGTHLLISGLPTSDPSVAGALYTATGAVKVSAG